MPNGKSIAHKNNMFFLILDSHFGTVTIISSDELQVTICDTSCEADNGKKDYLI